MVHRTNDPGAGAFSYHTGRDFFATVSYLFYPWLPAHGIRTASLTLFVYSSKIWMPAMRYFLTMDIAIVMTNLFQTGQ
jgi:hypothetical protein